MSPSLYQNHLRHAASQRVANETVANQTLELGKYAHEDEMPAWLVRLLETKGELRAGGKGILSNLLLRTEQITSLAGVVPVLQQLLEMSTRTEYAYLCHPGVQHVAKLRREGDS